MQFCQDKLMGYSAKCFGESHKKYIYYFSFIVVTLLVRFDSEVYVEYHTLITETTKKGGGYFIFRERVTLLINNLFIDLVMGINL